MEGGGRGGYNNNRRPNNNRRTGDYNPNAKYNFQKQLKYKEVLADPNEPIRLNKFLSNAAFVLVARRMNLSRKELFR